MKYLVTGGAGFIGSHLVERLVRDGNNVIVLDNLSSGKLDNINITETEFVNGDIRDAEIVAKLMEKVDACFHLAAIPSVELSKCEWVYTNQVNLGATINIFNQAAKKGVKIVYASSAAVYGDCNHLKYSELVSPSPISSYGVDKYSCELQGKIAAIIHNVPNIGLRFFNVYGPRQDSLSPYSGVITKFITNIKNGKDIIIFGDGEQLRDFVNVKDVVEFLIAAMDKVDLSARVLNVCTGIGTSVNTLAKLIAEEVGFSNKIKYSEARLGDIKYSIGDPTTSFDFLNIKAQINIREGIKDLLKYF